MNENCSYVHPENGEICNKPVRDGKKYCHAHVSIKFAETFCTHIKGQWANCRWQFVPWQRQLFETVYGTLRPNGKRQYRTIYVEVPKKNGKSELCSVAALIGLCADDEIGAEVYSAAGDREQAALVYYPAAQMVRNSRLLSKRLKIIDSRRRVVDYKTNSYYQVLSAEAFTKHGINPSVVIFDELHAQPNRELFDVLTEGTNIAREQQLVWIITTAGVEDKTSIGWEIHEYARQVSEGIIEDPSFLPVLYCASPEDDWQDENVWRRVNPSLDYIFDIESLTTHCREAKNNPARLNNFLRFRLNRWVGQISRYMPMDHWDACDAEVDKGALLKRQCYGGLDLSSGVDMSAFVLAFPPNDEDKTWRIITTFYMPEANMLERSRKDRVPYDMWVKAGLIRATPGNVIDYSFIRKDILNAAELYDLREVAFDPWGAVQLAVQLQNDDGIPMVEFRQGFKSMAPPTKELLKLVMGRKLAHGGHPVLRWNADNLSVKIDPAENVKPEKDKSRNRIDGVVAMIMAIGRAITNPAPKPSVYEERGIVTL